MQHDEATTGIVAGGVISDDPLHDLEGSIAECSERLYRVRLVQRFFLAWAFPGNLLIVTLAISAATAASAEILRVPLSWVVPVAVLVPLGSIAVSARAVYRQHFTVRAVGKELRDLQVAHTEHMLGEANGDDLLAAHKRYRAQLPEVIDRFRVESLSMRRKHNAIQCVVITGSIVTATTTAASVSIADFRPAAVGFSLLVAVMAAFGGYAKYRERSVNLQQTADALDREYQSVELRVGRYRHFTDERDAYAEFAHEVETVRGEQAKRLQHWGQAVVPEDTVVIGR